MDKKTDEKASKGTAAGTHPAESGRHAQAERQQRQADALRANLRRRKEQQRSRQTQKAPGDDA